MEKEKEIVFGKKTLVIPSENDKIRDIFKHVVDNDADIRYNIDGATIELVKIYPNISKTTVARVIRTSKELKLFSGCDLLVEFSGELWDVLNDDVKKIVMEHELLHVQCKVNNKTTEVTYHLVDHDVKDFKSIIEQYGIDWFSEIQNKSIELYPVGTDKDDDDVIKEKEKTFVKLIRL